MLRTREVAHDGKTLRVKYEVIDGYALIDSAWDANGGVVFLTTMERAMIEADLTIAVEEERMRS